MTVAGYNPVIFFAAKDRVPNSIYVPFVRHYEATFPKVYSRKGDAINFAKRNIEEEEGVWQLPGAVPAPSPTASSQPATQ